jgi:hypothetical protein
MDGPDVGQPASTARDWIPAALLITVIVAAVIVFFTAMIGAGPFCDCGTKPAG